MNDHISLTKKHVERVRYWIGRIVEALTLAGIQHDASKLQEPESTFFARWHDQLNSTKHGTPQYNRILGQMADGLVLHFQGNRHHPEHHFDGIAGMNLIDLTEMICDWLAASDRKGETINWPYASERFGIEPQLLAILRNTEIAMRNGEIGS